MSRDIQQLEPARLWRHFAALNEVPRGSKNEQRAVEFMQRFGESLGLETSVDAIGNVVIRKPPSHGMEDRVGVVLQGHLDMVQQKNSDIPFDFENQGIEMYVEGDWVRARGTTLGADNGIGVAAAMAVLAADDLRHPPIEALFTVDEETGMTGAQGLADGCLSGAILLNLDSEDDGEITIGCAGGVDVTVSGSYGTEPPSNDGQACRLRLSGLRGGHSGMDIHRGRGNANALLNRLLQGLSDRYGARLGEIDSGGLRNAIPREGRATVSLAPNDVAAATAWLAQQGRVIGAEYRSTDPELEVGFEPVDWNGPLMEASFQQDLLRALAACPNGIHRMSPEVAGLVQTSNNLARVRVSDGHFEVRCLVRSSVDSEKFDLAGRIGSLFELIGASAECAGAYPGWQPDPDAPIVHLVADVYEGLFGRRPPVAACHAGLECGLLAQTYPDMQMLSFGPNIRGAHSPDERVQVSSVRKFWRLLQAVLENIPKA